MGPCSIGFCSDRFYLLSSMQNVGQIAIKDHFKRHEKTIMTDRRNATRLNLSFTAVIALAFALSACTSAQAPMTIKMYHPETKQTLDCAARSTSGEYSPLLANMAESCARQLESKGFVRQK